MEEFAVWELSLAAQHAIPPTTIDFDQPVTVAVAVTSLLDCSCTATVVLPFMSMDAATTQLDVVWIDQAVRPPAAAVLQPFWH